MHLSRRKRRRLLKMDFLGLRNLTIIEESLNSFAKIKISILIFQPFLSTIKKHTCFSPAEKLPESFNSNPPECAGIFKNSNLPTYSTSWPWSHCTARDQWPISLNSSPAKKSRPSFPTPDPDLLTYSRNPTAC